MLVALSLACFVVGNGLVSLTYPDEVFYAQTATEMLEHNSWLTPLLFDQPQFEKPIVVYWLLCLSFACFGVGSFAARLVPAAAAMAGVLVVYEFGRILLKDERKALAGGLVLATSLLYVGLARMVMTDMLFSVLILLAIAAFYRAYDQTACRTRGIMGFFLFTGLAVLTKGPLGFVLPALIVIIFMAVRHDFNLLREKAVRHGFLLFAFLVLPWYTFMITRYGYQFVGEFFVNDHYRRLVEAEHPSNDTWFFYPLSLLAGMFPWSFYAVAGIVLMVRRIRSGRSVAHIFLAIWVFVVWAVFQVAHSKLVSYFFPIFPAVALLAGEFIVDPETPRQRFLRPFASISTSVVLLAVVLAFSIFAEHKYGLLSDAGTPAQLVFLLACVGLVVIAVTVWRSWRQSVPWNRTWYLSFVVPVFLFLLGLGAPMVEPFVSCRQACEFLKSQEGVRGPILCSKFSARAVRFYTGYDVAVVELNGNNYFSPHPIPFLKTEKAIVDFLSQRPVTYCLVRSSAAGDLEKLASGAFKYCLLKGIGDVDILRITPNGQNNTRNQGDRRSTRPSPKAVCALSQN